MHRQRASASMITHPGDYDLASKKGSPGAVLWKGVVPIVSRVIKHHARESRKLQYVGRASPT